MVGILVRENSRHLAALLVKDLTGVLAHLWDRKTTTLVEVAGVLGPLVQMVLTMPQQQSAGMVEVATLGSMAPPMPEVVAAQVLT
jgi:hypothetical protein